MTREEELAAYEATLNELHTAQQTIHGALMAVVTQADVIRRKMSDLRWKNQPAPQDSPLVRR